MTIRSALVGGKNESRNHFLGEEEHVSISRRRSANAAAAVCTTGCGLKTGTHVDVSVR